MAALGPYKLTHCKAYPSLRCIKQLRALFFPWMGCWSVAIPWGREGRKRTYSNERKKMQIKSKKARRQQKCLWIHGWTNGSNVIQRVYLHLSNVLKARR